MRRRASFDEAMATLRADTACFYGTSDIEGAVSLSQRIVDSNPEAQVYLYTDIEYGYTSGINVVSVAEDDEWNVAILDASAELNDGYYTVTVDIACYGANMNVRLDMNVVGANAEDNNDTQAENFQFSQSVECTDDETQRIVFRYGEGAEQPGAVGKAVNFLRDQPAPLEMPQNMPPRRRPDVDRQIITFHPSPSRPPSAFALLYHTFFLLSICVRKIDKKVFLGYNMSRNNQKRARGRKMLTSERQNKILEYLKERKTAFVRDLAAALYVSEATVRRDLNEMQKLGLIERSHGGAILPENAEEVSIFVRMNKNAREKERAATNALKRLAGIPFRSLFVDSSSTALALAARLDLSHRTVVTNNLQTAMQLAQKAGVNLILLGGSVQANTNSATGSWTVRQLADFSFDLMLASCAAVVGGEAFERSLDQKEIKRAAFERSAKRILVVDSGKFITSGTYRFQSLDAFDCVATDAPPPAELIGKNIPFAY